MAGVGLRVGGPPQPAAAQAMNATRATVRTAVGLWAGGWRWARGWDVVAMPRGNEGVGGSVLYCMSRSRLRGPPAFAHSMRSCRGDHWPLGLPARALFPLPVRRPSARLD